MKLKRKQSLAKRGARHSSTSTSSSSSNHGSKKLTQPSKYSKLSAAESSFQQLIDKNEDDLSSNSSSSTFSSSSQQQSSVDYEAEDENEDKQRRPLHKNDNDSLLHVQNFLKCFGPNAYASTKPPTPAIASKPLAIVKSIAGGQLRAWRQNYSSPINGVQAATSIATSQAAQSTTAVAENPSTSTAMFQAQSTANHKPTTKFQINTKFLRKPRNKLLKMLPTAAAPAPAATDFKQQEEELQQPQMFNDDSNAKFKDFSIDSLLNK
ncbi:uncharacterized protein LOC117142386 [Drosophila mauritiana]|uniref:Uncharacterized protein LOC117142386 n=1 Tax=Drosophila mauritiana TaxID=7226 RepID=A0A6P8KDI5_DROMA|nr:uncharacterized protein LOC117142386 [Drosophila mauritiana]